MTEKALDGLTRVPVREARRRFAELLRRAAQGSERIVVERHGKPVAAIVCVEDLDYLEAADSVLDAKMLRSLRRKRGTGRAAHRKNAGSARRR